MSKNIEEMKQRKTPIGYCDKCKKWLDCEHTLKSRRK